jgi:rubredoxin
MTDITHTRSMTCRRCMTTFTADNGYPDSGWAAGTCVNCRVMGSDDDLERIDVIAHSIADTLNADDREAFLSLHPETLRVFVMRAVETGKITL